MFATPRGPSTPTRMVTTPPRAPAETRVWPTGAEGSYGMHMAVDSLLPSDDDIQADYEEVEAVRAAMDLCESLGGPGGEGEGNEVSAFDDEELCSRCVEVVGPKAHVTFACSSINRMLCLHVKNLGKFMSFEVEVVDDMKRYRQISLSNHRSVATVDKDRATLPLRLGEGWQYVNIDLEEVTKLAWGSQYLTACAVRINGSCRVSKLFLQEIPFSDAELPKHLRVLA